MSKRIRKNNNGYTFFHNTTSVRKVKKQIKRFQNISEINDLKLLTNDISMLNNKHWVTINLIDKHINNEAQNLFFTALDTKTNQRFINYNLFIEPKGRHNNVYIKHNGTKKQNIKSRLDWIAQWKSYAILQDNIQEKLIILSYVEDSEDKNLIYQKLINDRNNIQNKYQQEAFGSFYTLYWEWNKYLRKLYKPNKTILKLFENKQNEYTKITGEE